MKITNKSKAQIDEGLKLLFRLHREMTKYHKGKQTAWSKILEEGAGLIVEATSNLK